MISAGSHTRTRCVMKLSFPGIGNSTSPPPKSPMVWPAVGPSAAVGMPDVTSSMSGAARQLNRLARLRQDDPPAFEEAATEVAATLRSRADEVGDVAGEALTAVASRFEALVREGQFGDLFTYRPEPGPFHEARAFHGDVVFAEVANAVRAALA